MLVGVTWVLGLKLRSPGLAASIFTRRVILLALYFYFLEKTPVTLSTLTAPVLRSHPQPVCIYSLYFIYGICFRELVGFQVVSNTGLMNLSFWEAKAGGLRVPG